MLEELSLSIKLKVEIRSEDLRPIVAFPVANLNKITSLKQPPLECGVQLPLEAGALLSTFSLGSTGAKCFAVRGYPRLNMKNFMFL